MNKVKRNWLLAGAVVLAIVSAVAVVKRTPALHAEDAIAVDAYIYGYPLVTLEMARRQQTKLARLR